MAASRRIARVEVGCIPLKRSGSCLLEWAGVRRGLLQSPVVVTGRRERCRWRSSWRSMIGWLQARGQLYTVLRLLQGVWLSAMVVGVFGDGLGVRRSRRSSKSESTTLGGDDGARDHQLRLPARSPVAHCSNR